MLKPWTVARGALMTMLFLACLANFASSSNGQDLPSGDIVIQSGQGDTAIVVTTTPRLAGAIHSVTWNGKEFIDSFDHGRQLQSASNLNLGAPIKAETFNPTEAGSRSDGAGQQSTSRLLHAVAGKDWLQTTTQMAFWLQPGQKSGESPAKNTTLRSDHLLTKRVRLGYKEMPRVIDYQVTFSLPLGERHTHAVFEAVTGYMPAEFDTFWQFNADSGELEPLSDGPGEQPRPVVLSTSSGSHAMGVYSRPPDDRFAGPGYGRFRFVSDKVTKWNCVYRIGDGRDPVPAADYSFRMFVVIGNQQMVTADLRALHAEFATSPERN